MTTLRRRLPQFTLACLLIVISFGTWAQAQAAPRSIVCQTYYGVCYVEFAAPIGYPCYCGTDPGRIVYDPRDPRLSDACATAYGVCRVGWAPIGSDCFCGRDRGRRIGR
jgi:hypothetical protein